MKSLCLFLAGALAVAGASAQGAEITHVASSGEPDHPFGADLWVGFSYLNHTGTISREAGACTQCAQATTDLVSELNYQQTTMSMPLRAAIGLYKDIEIHASTSIVFSDNHSWSFAKGTDASNSTVINNCFDKRWGNGVNGLLNPNCATSLAGSAPIFNIDQNGDTAYHSGLDNFTFGLAWAPMNDQRDDTKPTLVFGFDYILPTAQPIDSYQSTTWTQKNKASAGDNPPPTIGPIGDKVHKFDIWFALSKRMGYFDPYIKIFAEIPHQAPGFYTNCDHYFEDVSAAYSAQATVPNLPGNYNNNQPAGPPSGLNKRFLSYPENCGYVPDQGGGFSGWTREETGIKAPYIGGVLFGTEFNAYNSPEQYQKVAFDLRLGATYISEGRYNNELSDALQKQLYTQEYLQVGGQAGLVARAARYVELRLEAGYYYQTDHFLTMESIGTPMPCQAGVPSGDCGNNRVNLDNLNHEINPNFDFRYDLPGRRFKIQDATTFTLMATGVVNF